MPLPGPRLSLDERCFMQVALRHNLSRRAIAEELGRAPSTVSREIRRNTAPSPRSCYRAPAAHRRARQRARRPKAFKLERHPRLARHVERLLERKWSPEQIAAYLRRKHPDDERWWVSPEAIYRALYVQGRGVLKRELIRHLRQGRRRRRSGPERRGRFSDMVRIAERPPEADDRAVPGHWEGDLLAGSRSESYVGMLTERTTRLTLLFAVPDRSTESVILGLTKVVRKLPLHLRRSLTWDQGKEMSQHIRFTVDSGVQVYFCDPGAPWQRGTAENTVGLLRQYLPRTADLSQFSLRDLNAIAAELNGRPRKTLGWDSPAEAYARVVGVATTD
jgi:transposase, IS30 family